MDDIKLQALYNHLQTKVGGFPDYEVWKKGLEKPKYVAMIHQELINAGEKHDIEEFKSTFLPKSVLDAHAAKAAQQPAPVAQAPATTPLTKEENAALDAANYLTPDDLSKRSTDPRVTDYAGREERMADLQARTPSTQQPNVVPDERSLLDKAFTTPNSPLFPIGKALGMEPEKTTHQEFAPEEKGATFYDINNGYKPIKVSNDQLHAYLSNEAQKQFKKPLDQLSPEEQNKVVGEMAQNYMTPDAYNKLAESENFQPGMSEGFVGGTKQVVGKFGQSLADLSMEGIRGFLRPFEMKEDPETAGLAGEGIKYPVLSREGEKTKLDEVFGAGKEALHQAIPQDPSAEQSFLLSQLPEGIGSTVPFMLPGGAGLAMGAFAEAENMYQDAKSKGADDKTAMNAFMLGLPIGATEALPISRGMERLAEMYGATQVKGALMRAAAMGFENAAIQGVEEGIQEAGQNTLENLVAKTILAYDPDRKLTQGLEQAIKTGAGVGAVMGGSGGVFTGVKSQAPTDQQAADIINQANNNPGQEPSVESPVKPENQPVNEQGSNSVAETQGQSINPSEPIAPDAVPVSEEIATGAEVTTPVPTEQQPVAEGIPAEQQPVAPTEPVDIAPEEGASITLPPRREGGMPQIMVFKDGQWQLHFGGNNFTTVAPQVQQQAQEAFSAANQPEVQTTTNEEAVPVQPQEEQQPFSPEQEQGTVEASVESATGGVGNTESTPDGNPEQQPADSGVIDVTGQNEVLSNTETTEPVVKENFTTETQQAPFTEQPAITPQGERGLLPAEEADTPPPITPPPAPRVNLKEADPKVAGFYRVIQKYGGNITQGLYDLVAKTPKLHETSNRQKALDAALGDIDNRIQDQMLADAQTAGIEITENNPKLHDFINNAMSSEGQNVYRVRAYESVVSELLADGIKYAFQSGSNADTQSMKAQLAIEGLSQQSQQLSDAGNTEESGRIDKLLFDAVEEMSRVANQSGLFTNPIGMFGTFSAQTTTRLIDAFIRDKVNNYSGKQYFGQALYDNLIATYGKQHLAEQQAFAETLGDKIANGEIAALEAEVERLANLLMQETTRANEAEAKKGKPKTVKDKAKSAAKSVKEAVEKVKAEAKERYESNFLKAVEAEKGKLYANPLMVNKDFLLFVKDYVYVAVLDKIGNIADHIIDKLSDNGIEMEGAELQELRDHVAQVEEETKSEIRGKAIETLAKRMESAVSPETPSKTKDALSIYVAELKARVTELEAKRNPKSPKPTIPLLKRMKTALEEYGKDSALWDDAANAAIAKIEANDEISDEEKSAIIADLSDWIEGNGLPPFPDSRYFCGY